MSTLALHAALTFQGDIFRWYAEHKNKCPYCGINLSEMHPEANLYPHFTGACKAQKAPHSEGGKP